MRPLRFVLLIFCFIAIPVILTCISLVRGGSEGPNAFQYQQRSRLRALFSFSTPSSLFPPSAIISLTTDNSTFFVARPAAFGPSLPSKGLSGQLWVGRGFGDDSLYSQEDLRVSGFELGCSDVPGWGDEQKNTADNPALSGKPFKKFVEDKTTVAPVDGQATSDLNKREDVNGGELSDDDDGTDDHLHRPLPDSNPATPGKPGEPANANTQDKAKRPTHADIESLQESAAIAGKIVLLSRGGCGFLEKVKWAQRRGGIAVIVGDNEKNGQLTIMYAKGDTSNVTIPAIFTSYTSAHLLSSLVPPESQDNAILEAGKKAVDQAKEGVPGANGKPIGNNKNIGPIFTSTTTTTSQATAKSTSDAVKAMLDNGGWMQNVLHAVGLDDESLHGEDSRRPPGSGNIEWVRVKDWNEEPVRPATTGTQTISTIKTTSTSTKPFNSKSTTTKGVHNDDFVIGVQDWRDTEVIAPKPTTTTSSVQTEKTKSQPTSSPNGAQLHPTALKGGSIIPGSGEYESSEQPLDTGKSGDLRKFGDKSTTTAEQQKQSIFNMIRLRFGKAGHEANTHHRKHRPSQAQHKQDEKEGLWVTLTPTNVSTSPFFDTLLVLVVSPLVTLTFVYGLLLLRSRIRRRRWRAPKSVVERLPVRTYHTMSVTSSSTSSHLPSPDRSGTASPQLRPEPLRARQRSQTTIGVLSPGSVTSASPPREKTKASKAKRYRGRQIECVVCLEEYVDGESKVMSLPCGHEFHADCITPWLVNRRRTCPICKGDVVRSLARPAADGPADEDYHHEPEETSDDVQQRAATTVADDASAAIPIPESLDALDLMMEDDVERGENVEARPSGDANRTTASRWRGIINASVSTLSGDTVWRSSSVNDRTR